MIKLLFKFVLPLLIVLVGFLVGYNYFFGTPEEQQQSNQIITKFKDLGSEVIGLLHSEKEKFDAGKFDDALEKINSRIQQLSAATSSTTDEGKKILAQIEDLDEQRKSLVTQLRDLQAKSIAAAESAPGSFDASAASDNAAVIDELGALIESLANQTQQLSEQLQQ